jgi:hypothetical protein
MDNKEMAAGGKGKSELEWICRSVMHGAFPSLKGSEIRAVFYPYVGLTHTIRRKGGAYTIRISDFCASAPRIVLEAITMILGCKIMRRRPPIEMVRAYDRFRHDPEVEAAVEARRLKHGRKIIREEGEKHHVLADIYRELNREYFNSEIEIKKIGWGPRRSWGRLGHYDPLHHTITISPVLDSPGVPRRVLAFIVYHEMLHTLFNGASSRGRRRHHPPEFRKTERAYPDHAMATRFLAQYCREGNRSNRTG